MASVLKLLPTSILVLLKLKTPASKTDTAIQIKNFGSSIPPLDIAKWTTLIMSNEEMGDMKIVEFLEDIGLLIKDVSETVQNEAKQKTKTGKGAKNSKISGWGVIRAREGDIRAGEGTIRAGQNF